MSQEQGQTPPPPQSYLYYPEDEIDLAQLVGVIWRRRWAIVAVTAVCFAVALAYCLIAPKQYLISGQVAPGITGYSQDGAVQRSLTPKGIQEWFDKDAYLSALSAKLPSDQLKKIDISASTPRGSNVVTLRLYWPDPTKGVEILGSVIESLSGSSSSRLSKSLRVSRRMLDQAIKGRQNALARVELERKRLERSIELEKNRLGLIRQGIRALEDKIAQTNWLIRDINGEIKTINSNTRDLIRLRDALATDRKADKLSILMYSNIIQQNLSYAIDLRKEVSSLQDRVYDLELAKKGKEVELAKEQTKIKDMQQKLTKDLPLRKAAIETDIKTLMAKKESLAPVEVVQPPFSSLEPKRPKVKMILALSLVMGIFIGFMGAFLVDFWETNRDKISS